MRQQKQFEIAGLLTTFNREADRVAMHGVRRSLVKLQAEAAGIPLWEVPLPWPCANDDYESAMRAACTKAVAEGIEGIAFGDLFLADVRAYREKQLERTGLQPLFPVWGIPTKELAREMIDSGLRAKLTCIDCQQLDANFAGRDFDATLLSELPATADPCGENGEFHTVVYAGPMFQHEIPIEAGEVVTRDRFVFADFLPAQPSGSGRTANSGAAA